MTATRLRACGVAVVALLMTGCGGARTPSTPGAAGPHPAVTPRQAVMILGAVDAALVRATTARDVAAAGGRAVGPAGEGLAATIKVQRALKRTTAPPPAPTKPRLVLTRAETWPRWFLAAGVTPASATPVVRVLHSSTARSPYGLWGQLQLLPGAELPQIVSATAGVDPLGPQAPGLVRTPGEVLTGYAELLNRGEASPFRADFAADAYRSELAQQLRDDRRRMAAARAGEVAARHAAAAAAPFAVPTEDGGALVIGRVDETYQVKVARGRRAVRLDAALAALAGRRVVTKRLDRTTAQVLAFHVPAAGSSARIRLVAASRVDVAAQGA